MKHHNSKTVNSLLCRIKNLEKKHGITNCHKLKHGDIWSYIH